jgi:hypothetical protein
MDFLTPREMRRKIAKFSLKSITRGRDIRVGDIIILSKQKYKMHDGEMRIVVSGSGCRVVSPKDARVIREDQIRNRADGDHGRIDIVCPLFRGA